MRLPNAAHESRPWHIREIAPDFDLLDVWALPVHGDAEDFDALVELVASFDPADMEPSPARVLWRARELLGIWLGLDNAANLPVPGTNETSLAERLPDELCNTATGVEFGSVPFVPLYRTDVEFAAETSNKTVHGVIHLAWVDQGGARYQGQLAIYVKPRGLLGRGYMTLIQPFRHSIVYPALMHQIESAWNTRLPA